MKYLVDVEVTIKIRNVEINVDEFDKPTMVEKAIDKGLYSRRADRWNDSSIDIVGEGTLENWNAQ